ncbi:MAG: hypothetical protein N2035_08090 [Chthoniobacterales bacterium]|nr:hypothetical protein [Chthoniobacterales bacterium]
MNEERSIEAEGRGYELGEEVRKIMVLKKYEVPPAGFSEVMVKEFRRRRMLEAMRARGGGWGWFERFAEWAASFRVPGYAYGVAAFVAVICGALILSSDEIGVVDSEGGEEVAAVSASGNVPTGSRVEGSGDQREEGVDGNATIRMSLHFSPKELFPINENKPGRWIVGTVPTVYSVGGAPPIRSEEWGF